MKTATLGPLVDPVSRALGGLGRDRVVERIHARDHTLWSSSPREITNRMGWLTSPFEMAESIPDLTAFAGEVRARGFRRAVLIGMGGSSLAPELFGRVFQRGVGVPLQVLDTTDADTIATCQAALHLPTTLFIVSSKSGGTIETLSLYRFFFDKVRQVADRPGDQFVAITDPDSGLAGLARAQGFVRTFHGSPEIGGRYSALSPFGLVPAALVGVDLARLLRTSQAMAGACRHPVAEAPDANPGAWLGAVLGIAASSGRDKLTLVLPPGLEPLGDWIEQLVAESTGKAGRGIIPVLGEPSLRVEQYGNDRLFVGIEYQDASEGRGDWPGDALLDRLATAGHPVLRLSLADRYDLGAEFFRWEIATAVACHLLGVNPFDQPDVESAKAAARQALTAAPYGGGRGPRGEEAMPEIRRLAESGHYVGIQAYLPMTSAVRAALQRFVDALREATGATLTVGFGPRYLHSTGQLHKGMQGGVFLQLLGGGRTDLAIPMDETGLKMKFDTLKRAQAAGDREALRQAGRPVQVLDLGADCVGGLSRLTDMLLAVGGAVKR